MTIISPSILAADFTNLKSEVEAFANAQNIWFHLDIMDGHFVPNLTFGPTVLKSLNSITHHFLDAHCMVTNPIDHANWFSGMGISNFTFHIEAVDNPVDTIREIKKLYPSVGISIKPATPVEVLTDDILKLIDLVLVMSVEPGFGGQSFMDNSLSKLAWLKEKKKNGHQFIIQIDGGINDQTAKEAVKSGAENLVAGSYIFKADSSHYISKVESLR